MSSFTGLSVIIPTVDETKALMETVKIITAICAPEDIKEILIIYSKAASSEHREAIAKLEKKYEE